MDGLGLAYFIGYLSLALAVVLLGCVVLTFRPRAWVRPVILSIEAIAVISGLISMIDGVMSGLFSFALAAVVIAVLNGDDAQDWYRHGRSS